jgi:hypothetical protein
MNQTATSVESVTELPDQLLDSSDGLLRFLRKKIR